MRASEADTLQKTDERLLAGLTIMPVTQCIPQRCTMLTWDGDIVNKIVHEAQGNGRRQDHVDAIALSE